MLDVLRSPLLTRQGFRHGFSLRTGGVSEGVFASANLARAVGDVPAHVAENHRRFALAVGHQHEQLFELSQVHGNVVRGVHAGEDPVAIRQLEGDGLLATQPGLAIGVRAADCLPLLIGDPASRAVAAVHAGWRGTEALVVASGLHMLCAASGATSPQLTAAIFPHIRVCCFEVGAEVAERLAALVPGHDVIRRDYPKPHADLAAIVRLQLTAAGVPDAQIDDVPGCTLCEPERFYSFRRDGQRSGRHVAAIVAG